MQTNNAENRLTTMAPGFCLVLIYLLVAAATAFAHDPGLSSAGIHLERNGIDAHLTFARADIETLIAFDSDRDGKVSQAEFEAQRPKLAALAAEIMEVQLDGRSIAGELKEIRLDSSDGVHFRFLFPDAQKGEFNLQSKLIRRLARGHRQYLEIFNADKRPVRSKLLDATEDSFKANLSSIRNEEARPQSFFGFLSLGVEHILTGFDHLAFLFALLIAGASLREAVRIITSFTAAHSITLALATFNIVNLPANIVEPIIALSIVYVGIENLFRKTTEKRWILTFAFGLIHGFGFASVLREIGIGHGEGAALPLLSFNLGVELGQIAIAAILLPLIWKIKRMDSFSLRFAPALSVLIALAGAYWLIERMID